MDLTKLASFLTVAEELHFGRAAERLRITSSPLSRQIAQLERELGGDLFIREYHRVLLTPLGEALVEPVRAVLAGVDELPVIAASVRRQAQPLRVAATTRAPTSFVARFASAVNKVDVLALPTLDMSADSMDIVPKLLDGRLDLALLHLPAPDPALTVVPWTSYPLAVTVRADDPLATRRSVSLADLRGRKVVSPSAPSQTDGIALRVMTMLEEAGVTDVERVQGATGGIEIAREVLLHRLVTFVPNLPDTPLSSLMPPPTFVTIPVTDEGFGMRLGLAWYEPQTRRRTDVPRRVRLVFDALEAAPADPRVSAPSPA